MIHPLILKQKGSTLTISGKTLQQLLKKPKAILWCNDGLYGMVPIERVKNAMSIIKDRQKCKITEGEIVYLKINWSEIVEIPQETGRVMEKFNGGGKSEKSTNSGGLS